MLVLQDVQLVERERSLLGTFANQAALAVDRAQLSEQALRARLRHGNVYPPERAQQALAYAFQPARLSALRELALRRTADKTDHQLDDYMNRRLLPASLRSAVAALNEVEGLLRELRGAWAEIAGKPAGTIAAVASQKAAA